MHAVLLRLETLLTFALVDLDAEQTQLRPKAGNAKWSIQQIVEHLNLTYGSTCKSFETRLLKGTPTQASPSLRQWAMQGLVIALGVFPEGRPAPASVMPSASPTPMNSEALVAWIHAELYALDSVLEQAESKFGRRSSVVHQILGPLSVRQWRRFHFIHARHHVKQIRAIRLEQHIP